MSKLRAHETWEVTATFQFESFMLLSLPQKTKVNISTTPICKKFGPSPSRKNTYSEYLMV